MRIGITCYPTYGGSGAVATELGLELGRRGHEVHIISYASPFRLRGGFAERVTFHEVVPADYPLFEQSPYALALAVKQHEVALREGLELMHVNYAIPHAATAWLAKQMLKGERDLKVVTTLHGTDITLVGQDPSYFTITKFSIEQSDRVTAVSEYLKTETYRAFGCVGCDVRVIPNFVSVADFHPPTDGSCRRALAPAGHKILLHVSNFRPVKRVADVIKVFGGVRRALPATLVLAGDGPDRDLAEQEVDRLKLRADVRFLGKVDQVADLLRGGDLFLLPSQNESFGLSALEAMACGVPVIATREGGLPEVVVDGETGYLVPVGAVDEMTERGVALLKDGTTHERMRRAAAARALEFSAERIVPRYEGLYQAVLGGLAALAIMFLYSPVLKRRGLAGNFAVALVAGLPLWYGALAVGRPAEGVVPWALAAWLHLVREIVKDLGDEAGDRLLARRTLPITLGSRGAALIAAALGVAFVPASLVLPYVARYHGAYYVLALFAQLTVLLVASRLITGKMERNSLLLKGAMIVGIVSLVAGRVA